MYNHLPLLFARMIAHCIHTNESNPCEEVNRLFLLLNSSLTILFSGIICYPIFVLMMKKYQMKFLKYTIIYHYYYKILLKIIH